MVVYISSRMLLYKYDTYGYGGKGPAALEHSTYRRPIIMGSTILLPKTEKAFMAQNV